MDKLDKIIENIYPEIYGWSLPSDKWIKDINVYGNVVLTDQMKMFIWIDTLFLGLTLCERAIRTEVSEEDKHYFMDHLAKRLMDFTSYFTKKTMTEDNIEDLKKSFFHDYEKQRELYEKFPLTQAFGGAIYKAVKGTLSDPVITNFVETKVKLFEDSNITKRIHEGLKNV